MWRRSADPVAEFPDITDHGWTTKGQIYWLDDAFPEDLENLLADNNESDYELELGSDVESESDDANDVFPENYSGEENDDLF